MSIESSCGEASRPTHISESSALVLQAESAPILCSGTLMIGDRKLEKPRGTTID